MAKEAAKLSDQVILTSDNPRFEEPDDIINDMVAGLTKMDMERVLCITDRTQAIKTATMLAKKGDVILVAGKRPTKDYQEIKGVKHHFDDREKLRENFFDTTIIIFKTTCFIIFLIIWISWISRERVCLSTYLSARGWP